MITKLIFGTPPSEVRAVVGGTPRALSAKIRSTWVALPLVALAWVGQAEAATRCVVGAKAPPVPLTSGCIFYDDLTAAMKASAQSDEVRVYGSIAVPTTVSVRSAKLTGVAAVLDARSNPGTVLRYEPDVTTQIRITDITILLSGSPSTVGIEFGQLGQGITNLLTIIGPPDGQGVGVDIRPGVGRVTLNTTEKQRSEISGVTTAIRAKNAAGRPSPNGLVMDDVHVCMESIRETGLGTAQWFKNKCTCGRPDSWGFRSVGTRGEDHNGNVIRLCDIGIQIECSESGDCGARNQWANHYLERNGVPVRAYQRDGSFIDDYRADPACADQWGSTNSVLPWDAPADATRNDADFLAANTTRGC